MNSPFRGGSSRNVNGIQCSSIKLGFRWLVITFLTFTTILGCGQEGPEKSALKYTGYHKASPNLPASAIVQISSFDLQAVIDDPENNHFQMDEGPQNGASAVVFARSGQTYYAMTSAHFYGVSCVEVKTPCFVRYLTKKLKASSVVFNKQIIEQLSPNQSIDDSQATTPSGQASDPALSEFFGSLLKSLGVAAKVKTPPENWLSTTSRHFNYKGKPFIDKERDIAIFSFEVTDGFYLETIPLLASPLPPEHSYEALSIGFPGDVIGVEEFEEGLSIRSYFSQLVS